MSALAEIAREADDSLRREAAAETLQETYGRVDAADAADVADPLGDVLADGDAAERVRVTAATMLVLIHHRAAFRALSEAAPEAVGRLD